MLQDYLQVYSLLEALVTEEGLAEELDEDEDQVRVAVAVVAAIVVAAKLIKYYVNLFTI
jgi:hypothetical protein